VSEQKKDPAGPSDPIYYAPRWIRERNMEPGSGPQEVHRGGRPAPPEVVADLHHERGQDLRNQKQRDIFAEAIERAERQAREPVFVDAPPYLQERASIGVATKLAVAASVAILIAVGFVVAFPTSRRTIEDNALAMLPTLQSLKASLSSAPQRKSAPTLIVRDGSGVVNEPLGLGVMVDNPAPGVSVMIRRLPPDARLTAGKRVSATEWRIPAQAISDAVVIPPADFVGGLILSAELRDTDGAPLVATVVRLTWTPAPNDTAEPAITTAVVAPPAGRVAPAQAQQLKPAVAAPAPAAPVTALAPTTPAATASATPAPPLPAAVPTTPPARAEPVQELTPNEIAALVRRAQELLASGELQGARELLNRAAEARDARAALLLAKTFDPMASRRLGATDTGPDVAQARNWYQRAREWGSPEAQRQLDALASYPRQ